MLHSIAGMRQDRASKLSDEYHIPEMKPNAVQSAWSYNSPAGTQVVVAAKEIRALAMVPLSMSKTAS